MGEWYDAKDSALEFQGQEIIELKVLPIYNPMTKILPENTTKEIDANNLIDNSVNIDR